MDVGVDLDRSKLACFLMDTGVQAAPAVPVRPELVGSGRCLGGDWGEERSQLKARSFAGRSLCRLCEQTCVSDRPLRGVGW